ncbi:MutS-like protein [Chytridiales sp. JEL 0842]|nr:MutS-like protein [Chytridiales sp. JEL 0842]
MTGLTESADAPTSTATNVHHAKVDADPVNAKELETQVTEAKDDQLQPEDSTTYPDEQEYLNDDLLDDSEDEDEDDSEILLNYGDQWFASTGDFTKQYNRLRQLLTPSAAAPQAPSSSHPSGPSTSHVSHPQPSHLSKPKMNTQSNSNTASTASKDAPLTFGKQMKEMALADVLGAKFNSKIRLEQIGAASSSRKGGEGGGDKVPQKDKSDRATTEQVLDPRTRLILFKLLNASHLSTIHGCISTGKEANVYHATSSFPSYPPHLAVKIYKTSILVFKDRDRYVSGEFRFRNGYAKSNPRKMVQVWAEKETRNLKRLLKHHVPAPTPLLLRSNVLLMSLLGTSDGWASPRLKDAPIPKSASGEETWWKLYTHLLGSVWRMYNLCKLVHADLSEYNILYHNSLPYIIDVSQSVEHDHPHALEFLRKDVGNIVDFFGKKVTGLEHKVAGLRDVFEFIISPPERLHTQLSASAYTPLPPLPSTNHLSTQLDSEPDSTNDEDPWQPLLDAYIAHLHSPSFPRSNEMDTEVFKRIYIPRTLDEMGDSVDGVTKEGESGANVILKGAVVETPKAVDGPKVGGSLLERLKGVHVSVEQTTPPVTPAPSTRSDVLDESNTVSSHLPSPSDDDDSGTDSDDSDSSSDETNPSKLKKHEDKESKKARKAAVKEAQREKRKGKMKKSEKKRREKFNMTIDDSTSSSNAFAALAKQADIAQDKPAENLFVTFFKRLDPPSPTSTLRLFERAGGDYFTVHGTDALQVAETLFRTTSVLKYWGPESLPSVAVSRLNVAVLLRRVLVDEGRRIEIWESEGRSGRFGLGRKASPGNLAAVEDLMMTGVGAGAGDDGGGSVVAPVVMALKPFAKGEVKMVSVGYVDVGSGHVFGVAEFVDGEGFGNVESLMVQLSVKECLVPEEAGSWDVKRCIAILDRCGVAVTPLKRKFFDAKDIEQDLGRLLADEVNVAALPEFDLKNAMSCISCLINYLDLLSDPSNFSQYRLQTYDLTQYMRLDASAVRALNLLPSPQDGSNKSMSLFGLLNKTKTAQGARLLQQWLKQPLLSLSEIETRQNLVETFVNDTELRQTLQETHLKRFPDLNRLGKKFLKGKAGLQDVLRVYQVVLSFPGLVECLEGYEGEYRWLMNELYLEKLKEYMQPLGKMRDMVETTIDIEAAENHEYIIKADFDPELQETKKSKERLERQLAPEASKVADDLNVELDKKLKLENSPIYGWHLRLTKADSGKIRGKSQYPELATQKAGVLFTTSRLKRLSTEIEELRQKYDDLQSSLVKEIVSIAAGYFPVLERLNALVAHLDVLLSFAHVSVHAPVPYVRPKLLEKGKGDVHIKRARHPCLEVQDGVAFIANDVEMTREGSRFQIITGPNMGGKSTYIRQIGVVALMAQAGCFVPCDEASMPVFDAILARVGAGDSQLKGVSTFMAEMLETASILRAATPASLVIVDELGRGTSTYDGFGLAYAISEHIATKINCFALFATHFHELTTLSTQTPSVKNLHVTARTDKSSITLLYKVMEGVCDQSFGIHVAELAAFPPEVVRLAKRKAEELEDFGSGDCPSKAGKFSDAVVEEGDALIQTILKEYYKSVSELQVSGGPGSDEWQQQAFDVLQGLKKRYEEQVNAQPFLRELLEDLGGGTAMEVV